MRRNLPAHTQPTATTTDRLADRVHSRGFHPKCNPRGCAGLCSEEGLAAAYRNYHARLLSRAQRVVVDPHLAEEAAQEALLRAWRSCASFDPEGEPMENWLLVIARNVAIDLVKARTRRPPVAPAVTAAEKPATGISDIDQVLLRDQLRDALAGIGREHRHAVVETILRDRPYGEVAADFGVPPGTIRSRVHYGLRRLRVQLEAAEAAA